VDLDWFWRGWFYGTDHVDIALKEVKWFQIDTKDPEVEKTIARGSKEEENRGIGYTRNQEAIKETVVERDEETVDFYNKYDPFQISVLDKEEHGRYLKTLSKEDLTLLDNDDHYYELTFLEFEYTDGTKEVQRIPAEVWRIQDDRFSKVFVTEQEVKSITLDPFLETADVDLSNNVWPPRSKPSRFQLFKQRQSTPENPMQRQERVDEREKEKDEEKKEGKDTKTETR